MTLTEKQDNGGPAFPRPTYESSGGGMVVTHRNGMSLRDWFAGQALTGLASVPCGLGATEAEVAKSDAERAYAYADAMLAARKIEASDA